MQASDACIICPGVKTSDCSYAVSHFLRFGVICRPGSTAQKAKINVLFFRHRNYQKMVIIYRKKRREVKVNKKFTNQIGKTEGKRTPKPKKQTGNKNGKRRSEKLPNPLQHKVLHDFCSGGNRQNVIVAPFLIENGTQNVKNPPQFDRFCGIFGLK